MTDNDIIKALECCRDFGDCSVCPYEKATFEDEADCAENMHTDALDLINRQKEEIERLTEESKEAVSCFHRMESLYNIKCMELKVSKVEAIKEFAERLKESAFDCDVSFGYGKEHYTQAVAVLEIDRIAKEMTGNL